MLTIVAVIKAARVAKALNAAKNHKGLLVLLATLLGAAALGVAIVVFAVLSAAGVLFSAAATADTCTTSGGPDAQPGSPGGYTSQKPSDEAVADIPPDYLKLYEKAGEDYGIDWTIIAAIGKHESDHGRYEPGCEEGPPTPYGTAKGPMQFIDSTWESVGLDGDGDGVADVCNPADAIPTTAKYLKDAGAPGDYYGAIYAYNHDDAYVQWVLDQAKKYRAAAQDTGTPALIPPVTQVSQPVLASAQGAALAATKAVGAVGSAVAVRPAGADAQGWDLVDAYKHLDYADYTAYDSALDHAVSVWNDLRTVKVEPSSGSGTDVLIGDGSLQPGIMGMTYTNGNITLNPDLMNGATQNAQNAAVGHEMGHALGLGHTPQASIMNNIITNSNSNYDVPTDYDKQVYYGIWGQPTKTVPASNQGGGGVEGNQHAVFPLPKQYFDSYEDTWGASRSAGRTHEGTDVFAPDGTELYSITDGTVVQVSDADSQGWNELGGWTIMVEADYSIGPIVKGDMLYYAHMNNPQEIPIGTHVKAGQMIGYVGSTGEGSPGTILPDDRGHHLHLGWYDPTMQRAEAASDAMNPYPLLNWLKENGGTVTGGGTVAPQACPESDPMASPDGGGSTKPGSGSAEDLLSNPNLDGSSDAIADLRSGNVDERLVAVLQAVAEKHKIYLSVIKTGHPFGPTIPGGYGSAGGAVNTHYYYRAADIAQVDGMPVEGNGTDPAVLDVGKIIHGIPPGQRPDEIVGPPDWTNSFGYTREEGFITDPSLTQLHTDHIHSGFQSESGTSNTH